MADTSQKTWEVAKLLKDDPKRVAPELLTIVLVSLIVSGGPDGDGGIPDMDIALGGIGTHRAI